MECRGAGGAPAGGDGNVKTSEKANVFCNLTELLGGAASQSRPHGSQKNCIFVHMMLAKGTPP